MGAASLRKRFSVFLCLFILYNFINPSYSFDNNYKSFSPSKYSEKDEVVLIRWNSEEGKSRLISSKYKNDFYQLANFYQPQINPLYCGIASSVIVLNAMRVPENSVPSQEPLEIKKPEVWGGDTIPFPSYSQLTLLNEKTDEVKHRKVINLENITKDNTNDESEFDPGLTLAQLKSLLEVYNVDAVLNYADVEGKKSFDNFRNELKNILSDKDKFVIVNFIGKEVGASTGGHISPLAAYDQNTDSVLILDVAGHKNPWYWVPLTHLYRAMHTKDGRNYRGWLIVSDSKNNNSSK